MKKFKKTHVVLGASLVTLLAAGCATGPSADEQDMAVIRASFKDHGIAKVDRLNQDDANDACSKTHDQPAPDVAKAIEAAQMKTIRMPSDGKFLGDWKAGEKLAQSGKGMTWSDKSTDAKDNGGNCYNCHQLTKAEISYGTIGPSLYHYGKLRGVTDPNSAAARPMVEYTWGKLWNARAYNACSNMPRFGHNGIMNEGQLRDLMALLLDPKSAVNQ